MGANILIFLLSSRSSQLRLWSNQRIWLHSMLWYLQICPRSYNLKEMKNNWGKVWGTSGHSLIFRKYIPAVEPQTPSYSKDYIIHKIGTEMGKCEVKFLQLLLTILWQRLGSRVSKLFQFFNQNWSNTIKYNLYWV